MPKLVDLKGKTFGKLTVLELVGSSRGGSRLWKCECDCGNFTNVSTRHLNRKNNNIRSCGCITAANKGSNHAQWKGYGEISAGWWWQRIERTSHRRKEIEITLTMKEAWELFLKQNRKCALSGLDLVISNKSFEGTASLDRIDSSKGYILDNVQWVHKDINYMKRIYSQDYFIEMCKHVANNNRDDRN